MKTADKVKAMILKGAIKVNYRGLLAPAGTGIEIIAVPTSPKAYKLMARYNRIKATIEHQRTRSEYMKMAPSSEKVQLIRQAGRWAEFLRISNPLK